VFLPLCCGRSHPVSPLFVCLFFVFSHKFVSPRRLSGERPQLGDGVPKLALGGPPGGVPGADPSSGPYLCKQPKPPGPGGVRGGPRGGPGGVSVGPRGPLGGSGGPSRGGTPRGAPRGAPTRRHYDPGWGRPPRGGPPGGPPGGHPQGRFEWQCGHRPGPEDGSAPGTPPGGPPRASFGTPSPKWGPYPERRRGARKNVKPKIKMKTTEDRHGAIDRKRGVITPTNASNWALFGPPCWERTQCAFGGAPRPPL
jgi:hypothetical protein